MKINRPTISILTGQIAPTFFAPPDEGGGGNTGVMEVPVEIVPPPVDGSDPNDDILSFEMPDPDAVARALEAPDSKMPEPGTKKPDPKPDPAAKKPEDKKPAPETKPTKKENGEPPIGLLRKELDSLKAEKAELLKKVESGDPRVKALETEIAAAKEEVAKERERATEYERKIIATNAENHPDVLAINKDYDQKSYSFYDRVPDINQSAVMGLVQESFNLPPHGEKRAEAMRAFIEKVNTALGAQDGGRHPDLSKTLDFIDDTRAFFASRSSKLKEVQANNETYEVERFTKQYQADKTRLDGLISKSREIPEGMAVTDPTHPAVVLSKIRKELGERDAQFEKGIDEFTRLVLLGAPPRSSKDYAGMTEAQIQESRTAESKKVEKAREYAANVLPNGLYALRVVPHLVREISRLRAALGEDTESTPPDPSKGRQDGTPVDDNDLANFTPPSIPEFS